MKKLVAIAICMASVLSASAQSGLSCSEAIPLSPGAGSTKHTALKGSEMWFTFTSGEAAEDIVISTGKTTKAGKGLEKMELFSGHCGALVKLDENSITPNGAIFPVGKKKPAKGTIYYLKITGGHSAGQINFDISQRSSGGGGGNHTAFLCANGTVKCAGSNTNGQLGDGTTVGSSATPVSVTGLTNVTAIAAGAAHTLALLSNGTVQSWGSNTYGELGDGTTTDSNTPVTVSGLSNVVQISAGDNFSMALKSNGTVWVWGWNTYGQLGDGTNTDRHTPVQITSLTGVTITDIEAGAWHAMALASGGTIYEWGQNSSGQLGINSTTSYNSPQTVPSYTATAISAGDYHSVIINSSGVYATGDNTMGQLGNGSTTASLVYTASTSVNAITGTFQQISCGTRHTIALRNDLTVWAWGENWFGQLGNGTTSVSPYLSVVQASGLSCAYEISAGWQFSTASTMNGTVYTWGTNFIGQLGDGTTTDQHAPNPNGTCNRLNPISISGTPAVCIGSGTTLTASGGPGTYSWSPSTGLNVTTGSVVIASPTTTTAYTVTDATGCTSTTVTITVNPLPTISIAPASPLTCSGHSITLTGSGASTYTWSTGPTTNTVSIAPTTNTSYTVTGTDANGCVNTASIIVNVNAPGPCCVPPTLVLTGSTTTSSALGSLSSGSVVVLPSMFNLVIDNNPTYTNVVFRLQALAKITVQSLTSSSTTNTLTLDNCQLYMDCGSEMWDGIYLEHDGSTHSANLTMRNGTSMEDAVNGIVANSYTTTVGATISISNCLLNKNYYNVQLSNYTDAVNYYPLTIKTSTVSCASSTYSPGSTLNTNSLSATRTYAGFKLSSVRKCYIGKNTASTDVNYFSDMDYGVYSLNSGTEVVNGNFSSLTGNVVSSVPNGVGIYAPNTSASNTEIRIGGAGTYDGNTFSDVFRVIDASNVYSVEVSKCQASCTTTPASFAVSGNLTSQYGVKTLNVNSLVDVRNSSFTNFANAVGIRRNSTTSTTYNPTITVESNTVTPSGSGYVSNGIVVADASGNTITSTATIRVRDNTLPDIRDNGIVCQNILNHPVVAGTSALSQSIGMIYSSSSPAFAVSILSCSLAVVSNNSISSTLNSNTNMVGVYLYKSQASLVICNTISTIGICLRAEGNCKSPYTSSSSYAYGILRNTFDNGKGGISLISGGDIGKQGTSTPSLKPVGNMWINGTFSSGYLLTDGFSNPDVYTWKSLQTNEDPSGNLVNWSSTLIANNTGANPTCPGASTRMAGGAIGEENNSTIIALAPNPNNGHFTVSSEAIIEYAKIEVFDLQGKKLQVFDIRNFNSQPIDLSEFNSGLYYIHVSGNGISETIRAVKE